MNLLDAQCMLWSNKLCCFSIKDIGSIYYFLATSNQDKVEQYHSKTPDSVKTDITRRFNNPASRLKVVISSSAFSMGTCVLV